MLQGLPLLFALFVLLAGVSFTAGLLQRGAVREGPCQTCGREAPLAQLTFRYNIGMLIARRSASIQGWMCRRCAQRHFARYTGIDLVAGWWGVLSMLVTPAFACANLHQMGRAVRLPASLAPGSGFAGAPPAIG